MQGPNTNPAQIQSCNEDFLKQMLSNLPPSPNSNNYHHISDSALMLLHSPLSFHQTLSPQPPNHFQHPPLTHTHTHTAPPSTASALPKHKVRARRGQATDPHSIAERLRRERIAERMKALQELVPNANKTDKASMLDEIIDYVKFLQLQVKVLSMSRLGVAAAVAPIMAEMSSEEGKGKVNGKEASTSTSNSNSNSNSNERLALTEQQVAKLMEEDMGSAMQYLQGKGLCLMPISLATAISNATSRTLSFINDHDHDHDHAPPPANALLSNS